MGLTKDEKREYQREYMRKRRSNKEEVYGSNNIEKLSILKRPNQLGSNGLPEMRENYYDPEELLLDGTKRYLGPLSDGQVLDRLSVPPLDIVKKRSQIIFTPNRGA